MCQIEPDRSSVDAETQSRSSNRCHRVNNWINFEGGINRSPHFSFFSFHLIKSFRFGILGHAANLASNQKEAVDMVIKLMTTISCSFWRRFSVNFGSMLGWITNAFEGAAHVADHQGHDWHCQDHGQHVPTPPGTNRSLQTKTTYVNQWITGLQRGDERGLVDEHLGGRSQSFFWRDPRHWRPARLGDWHSGGSEQHCCWILLFFYWMMVIFI